MKRIWALAFVITIVTVAVVGMILFRYKLPVRSPLAAAAKPTPLAPTVTAADIIVGAAKPTVTIIAYEDFYCPHCAEGFLLLEALRTRYVNELAIVWKDAPLSDIVNRASVAMHAAARCADEQKKFWDFVGAVFNDQPVVPGNAERAAEKIGLDLKTFDACVKSRRYETLVRAMLREADAAGVQSTPTYFVNGKRFDGTPSMEEMEKIIQSPLK
ncbi:MAG: DSBA oxidoreductase [Candidatus Magasanikbacteria bacterium]|nr:DSBA oxidoreductase [Candidatus Magasanikbacteria bacterium]